MIASQGAVIKLQEEFISCKNEQLESVQAAVKTIARPDPEQNLRGGAKFPGGVHFF